MTLYFLPRPDVEPLMSPVCFLGGCVAVGEEWTEKENRIDEGRKNRRGTWPGYPALFYGPRVSPAVLSEQWVMGSLGIATIFTQGLIDTATGPNLHIVNTQIRIIVYRRS